MKKIERVINIGRWKERETERERGPREEVKVGVSNDKVGGDSCNI